MCSAVREQVREAKARGRPYTIVFVGVNGVGKSTNLAKVAYWLLQNDVSARPRSYASVITVVLVGFASG